MIIATYGDRQFWEPLAQRAFDSIAPGRTLIDQSGAPPGYTLPPLDDGETEIVARHLEEATLAEARNQLAGEARGDWLCFLDGDDELGHGYLRAMRTRLKDHEDGQLEGWGPGFLRRSGLSLLSPALQYVEKHGRVLPAALPNRQAPIHDLNHCVIGTLVPRDLFLEVGGFRELAALEDWELWLRCIRAGATIVDVPDAVYRAHMRDGSRNLDQSLYEQIRNEHLTAIA